MSGKTSSRAESERRKARETEREQKEGRPEVRESASFPEHRDVTPTTPSQAEGERPEGIPEPEEQTHGS
ncbi:hypothetical protein [Streptomyces sp. TRM49041]|uniref:hypothetical protein n=1 Tax=Streptomyces sp. TRM49041 TaxID=2603216 RepID=UPI0011EE84F2|nr:hypothetical protein [Streptomyces sp. TRM49041]